MKFKASTPSCQWGNSPQRPRENREASLCSLGLCGEFPIENNVKIAVSLQTCEEPKCVNLYFRQLFVLFL